MNVIGPIIGYSPQYLLMSKEKSSGSFSPYICIIMLIAHSLRLEFYKLKPYHISLFLQSVMMLFIQSILLEKYYEVSEIQNKIKNRKMKNLCIKSKENYTKEEVANEDRDTIVIIDSKDFASKEDNIFDQNSNLNTNTNSSLIEKNNFSIKNCSALSDNFDNKEEESVSRNSSEDFLKCSSKERITIESHEYLECIQLEKKEQQKYFYIFTKTLMMITLFVVLYFFLFMWINQVWFAEWTGTLSCTLEAILPVTQFWANFKSKSVDSLSLFMIVCWFLGDIGKMVFLMSNHQPVQFILSTANLILFDFLILCQFKLYDKKVIKQI